MGKLPWQCTTTGLDNSIELRMEKIRQAVTEIWVPQVWQPPARPPARPPEPWRQYPSSPKGWGVKSCFGQNYECVYKVWCQTIALKSWYLYFLPDTPETTFDWDRRWNPAESRDSVHRSHPENSRPMTRPPRNHRTTFIYQILHLCTVELTWTCTMQSEA